MAQYHRLEDTVVTSEGWHFKKYPILILSNWIYSPPPSRGVVAGAASSGAKPPYRLQLILRPCQPQCQVKEGPMFQLRSRYVFASTSSMIGTLKHDRVQCVLPRHLVMGLSHSSLLVGPMRFLLEDHVGHCQIFFLHEKPHGPISCRRGTYP